jgi:hypothetical protein
MTAGKGPLKEVWYITIAPGSPSPPMMVPEGPPGGGLLKNISYKYIIEPLNQVIPILIEHLSRTGKFSSEMVQYTRVSN